MNELQQELKQALKDGNLFDFIANEGYRFSKDELISIIKELNYSIFQCINEYKPNFSQLDVKRLTLSNLKENSYIFEEE